jgi:hypothetical protein
MKLALLAAYIASHNPKNTDNLKFISDRSKKRRKTDVVKENNVGNQDNDNANDKNNTANNSNNNSSQIFSIERLLSIYAQILFLCDHSLSSSSSTTKQVDYGAPDLHSMIETLVLRRLVWKAAGYKVAKPMYGSAVNKALAENIAQSLQFPLNDFLYEPSKNHFTW